MCMARRSQMHPDAHTDLWSSCVLRRARRHRTTAPRLRRPVANPAADAGARSDDGVRRADATGVRLTTGHRREREDKFSAYRRCLEDGSLSRSCWSPCESLFARPGSFVLRFQPETVNADAEFAHFLLKVLPVHPCPLRGARDVAAVGPECVDEEIAFPLLEELFFGFAEIDLAAARRRVGRHACRRDQDRVAMVGVIGTFASRAIKQFPKCDFGAR